MLKCAQYIFYALKSRIYWAVSWPCSSKLCGDSLLPYGTTLASFYQCPCSQTSLINFQTLKALLTDHFPDMKKSSPGKSQARLKGVRVRRYTRAHVRVACPRCGGLKLRSIEGAGRLCSMLKTFGRARPRHQCDDRGSGRLAGELV